MSERRLYEARIIQRNLHALLILSSDVASEFRSQLQLNVDDLDVDNLKRAARAACASLLGGVEAIYDLDVSLEFAEGVLAHFYDELNHAGGERLAAAAEQWVTKTFAFGQEAQGEHAWTMWLLDIFHGRHVVRGLSESSRHLLKCAIEEHLVAMWHAVGRVEAETRVEPRSAWDRRVLELVAPRGSSMEGITILDSAADTFTSVAFRRAWAAIRRGMTRGEVDTLASEYRRWATEHEMTVKSPPPGGD